MGCVILRTFSGSLKAFDFQILRTHLKVQATKTNKDGRRYKLNLFMFICLFCDEPLQLMEKLIVLVSISSCRCTYELSDDFIDLSFKTFLSCYFEMILFLVA